jgi:Zn finger protein HypA/HybF involved in hydrogenase expression
MRLWRIEERNRLVNRWRAGDDFEELATALNRTEREIKAELKRLGEMRKPPAAGPRPCIKCKREFHSKGDHNRLCPNCRESNARLTCYSEAGVEPRNTGHRETINV